MSILNTDWFHDLTNEKKARAANPAELPKSRRSGWKPEGYLPDPGLADALRVALVLRKPLLLTGEPGTGKTECAAYLAWKLGYGEPLAFEAKSVSEAKDLFYTYDTLGRFHAKEEGKAAPDARTFIHFNALGEAILRTLAGDAVADVVPPGWEHGAPRQSVVLIDEIDKAPRDFPNDLLNEVDRLYFRIPELGNRIKRAAEGLEPVLVITSNSEKNLPPAFLRRCVYYHIPFPKERLETIVGFAHAGSGGGRERDGPGGDRVFPLFARVERGTREAAGDRGVARLDRVSASARCGLGSRIEGARRVRSVESGDVVEA